MEAVPLDSGEYTGTYKLVGGRLALDFVNTVSWPDTPRRHEWLHQPANACDWAEATGLLPRGADTRLTTAHQAAPDNAATALRRLVALRTDLTAVLSPLAHGDRPALAAIERLNHHLARVAGRRQIDPAKLVWAWPSPASLDDLHGPIVGDATDLVVNGDRTRFGYCPSCDWLFVDTTRNRSRRWCDMADCGSRDKALRYYHRKAKG